MDLLKRLREDTKTLTDSNNKREQLLRIDLLENYQGDDRVIRSSEILAEIEAEGEMGTIQTGFKELDDLTGGGFRPEDLIIMSGATKNGKSQFALELASRVKNTLFFGFEQSPKEFLYQMRFIQNRKVFPEFVTPKENLEADLEWIEERATESFVKYNTKLLIIDHFDFIRYEAQAGLNEATNIKNFVTNLKALARKLKQAIVLIVHIRKGDPYYVPTYDDIKGSSSFAQLCDKLIMVKRLLKQNGRNKAPEFMNGSMVSLQLNRQTGQTGNLFFEIEDYKHKYITSDEDTMMTYLEDKEFNHAPVTEFI